MTYVPTIPQASQPPSVIYNQIQTNFSQFASLFSSLAAGVNYNHMPFNDPNQGKHAAVIFQSQTTTANTQKGFTTVFATQVTNAIGTSQQLCVQIPVFLPTSLDNTISSNGRMQISYNQVNTSGPVYQSFMIGGYVLYFGQVTFNGTSTVVTIFPNSTKILMAMAIPTYMSTSASPGSASTFINTSNTFTIYKSTIPLAPTTYNWMAIAQQ